MGAGRYALAGLAEVDLVTEEPHGLAAGHIRRAVGVGDLAFDRAEEAGNLALFVALQRGGVEAKGEGSKDAVGGSGVGLHDKGIVTRG